MVKSKPLSDYNNVWSPEEIGYAFGFDKDPVVVDTKGHIFINSNYFIQKVLEQKPHSLKEILWEVPRVYLQIMADVRRTDKKWSVKPYCDTVSRIRNGEIVIKA